MPSRVSTMAFSSEPPRIRSTARSFSSSSTKPKVRARASRLAESFAIDRHLDLLAADHRMRIVDQAMHAEFVAGIDADVAIAVGDFERAQDFQVAPAPALAANAGLRQHLDERLRRAIENGDLDGVDIDVDVVDAAGVKRRKKVLGGGKQHALFHQAGGVADAGDVAAMSLDFKIVEIDAAEDDAGVRRRRHQTNAARDGGVKTNSGCFDGALYSRLGSHIALRCI